MKQELFDDPRLGATREERQNRVFRGGLRIYTTLDPRAQLLATVARNDVLAEIAPEGTPTGTVPIEPDPDTGKARNATGAVVSVEPGTGAVRAMVGGAGFASEKYNVTTQGVGRSGGSTFKIFVLMALLENGYLPTDSVNGGGPCTFRDIPGMDPDPYRVENFANSGGGGGTILSQTLRSSNCAFVRLGQIVGIDNVVEQAHKMGITTPLEEVVSMPLGTKEVHPIDMAAAVASIAADGMFNPPYYIDRVEGPDGRVLFAHEPDPRRASSIQSARLAADVLEKNVISGTGNEPGSRASTRPARRARRRTPATAGSSASPPTWPPRCGSDRRRTTTRSASPGRASPAARTRPRSGAATCAPGTRGWRSATTRTRSAPRGAPGTCASIATTTRAVGAADPRRSTSTTTTVPGSTTTSLPPGTTTTLPVGPPTTDCTRSSTRSASRQIPTLTCQDEGA